ncbi:hypothetical protein ACQJBY_051204 [Aegilops geniculata]
MDTGEIFNRGCSGPGGAGCDCWDCEEWRRYCYWNHDHGDGGAKQFLLFASDDKDQLCIPWEITSQLRDMIPDSRPIKLETPDGHTYNVEFVKFGLITLTTGWRGFVDANHIRHGDPMLFVYSGNSTFKVHIFNSPGHDKFLSCSQPPCGHDVLNEQVVPHPGHVDSSAHFGYTMLPGSFVTKAQDDKLLEWAHTIKSGYPLFVAAMDETNVSLNDCHVYIPLSLVGQLEEKIVKVVAPDESVYGVKAKKHNGDQIVLLSGWDKFVASQCIQQNDFLIFIVEGKARLKVLILDPSGSEKTPCFGMGNSSNAREVHEDSVEIVDKEPTPPTVDLSSDDDEVIGEGTRKSCRRQKGVPGYAAHKTHDRASAKEVGVRPSQRPYILPMGVTLPRQVEKKVEEKVQSILSELPIFVKVMTTSSVAGVGSTVCSLVFCKEYIWASLRGRTGTIFLQLEGGERKWRTTLSVRGDTTKTIASGWKEFAMDNHLEVGDVCLFQMQKGIPRSYTMTVYLIRKSETEP